MKKLVKLSINTERIINKNELLLLKGGDSPCGPECGDNCWHCWCTYGPGEWYGCYPTDNEVKDAINNYCSNLGSCERTA